MEEESHPYNFLISELKVKREIFHFFNLLKLNDLRYDRMPFCIRVLLESAIRNCDNFQITQDDISKILDWEINQNNQYGIEVPFRPSRVILQDFTGVPAVVDFAAMRDSVKELGGDPEKINPICPADLVIDHSVQVDFSRTRMREMSEMAKGIRKDCGSCFKPGGCGFRAPLQLQQLSHLPNSRRQPPIPSTSSSRPSSPYYSRPSSPLTPQYGILSPTPMLYNSPCVHSHSYYSMGPSLETSLMSPLVPVLHPLVPYATTSSVIYSVPSHTTDPSMGAPYYTGTPYIKLQPNLRSPVRTPTEELSPWKSKWADRQDSKVGPASQSGGESAVPSLHIAVSSLPSPQDAAGIPVQDSVCPFHQLSSTWSSALQKNEEVEFERNKERFTFLKWGSKALKNLLIVPPGSGIVHQVNLEYLARVVFEDKNFLYPDSLVGTDSHTTMINGLGIVGWGVGGIEAEAVMLGQAISMVLPQVVGYKLTGKVSPMATSTDIVLTITKHLRQVGVVGKFVEFFGEGVAELSLADRATISNMCPEYGATIGFFPVDDITILYLQQTNRDAAKIEMIESYLKAVKMFRNYSDSTQDPVYSEVVELDLNEVVPSISGPKRPHDKVAVATMKEDFQQCLIHPPGFKGFGISEGELGKEVSFTFAGKDYALRHGSIVISAITSCTNTSNPSVMLGAGLLAQNAVEKGLSVSPYIKTSLSPGSGVVTHYLQHSGVIKSLKELGFDIVGYGCMTCIGNSGPLPESVVEAIEKGDLVCCGILSGNRNFEGRIHPHTRANYLASPLLVIAYAIAGTVNIDFELDPLGKSIDGSDVFLRDIWPSREDIQTVERESVLPAMFSQVYEGITSGNDKWNALEAPDDTLYPWDPSSTYIKRPPFFQGMTKEVPPVKSIIEAYVLLHLGDSVTTDHISPAGSIARSSPAARFLSSKGLTNREFNSYGSRRGNDAVMARGTFANIRILNKMIGKPAPKTIHIPTGEQMDIFDAAERYREEGHPVILLAGKEYGSGSSRDWAAKGPFLLGVRAVIAESYERIHRSNLVGMGIIPLQFKEGQNADGLTGKETFTIELPESLLPGMDINVKVSDGRSFSVRLRFDTEVEVAYFRHGGILNYMIRKLSDQNP